MSDDEQYTLSFPPNFFGAGPEPDPINIPGYCVPNLMQAGGPAEALGQPVSPRDGSAANMTAAPLRSLFSSESHPSASPPGPDEETPTRPTTSRGTHALGHQTRETDPGTFNFDLRPAQWPGDNIVNNSSPPVTPTRLQRDSAAPPQTAPARPRALRITSVAQPVQTNVRKRLRSASLSAALADDTKSRSDIAPPASAPHQHTQTPPSAGGAEGQPNDGHAGTSLSNVQHLPTQHEAPLPAPASLYAHGTAASVAGTNGVPPSEARAASRTTLTGHPSAMGGAAAHSLRDGVSRSDEGEANMAANGMLTRDAGRARVENPTYTTAATATVRPADTPLLVGATTAEDIEKQLALLTALTQRKQLELEAIRATYPATQLGGSSDGSELALAGGQVLSPNVYNVAGVGSTALGPYRLDNQIAASQRMAGHLGHPTTPLTQRAGAEQVYVHRPSPEAGNRDDMEIDGPQHGQCNEWTGWELEYAQLGEQHSQSLPSDPLDVRPGTQNSYVPTVNPPNVQIVTRSGQMDRCSPWIAQEHGLNVTMHPQNEERPRNADAKITVAAPREPVIVALPDEADAAVLPPVPSVFPTKHAMAPGDIFRGATADKSDGWMKLIKENPHQHFLFQCHGQLPTSDRAYIEKLKSVIIRTLAEFTGLDEKFIKIAAPDFPSPTSRNEQARGFPFTWFWHHVPGDAAAKAQETDIILGDDLTLYLIRNPNAVPTYMVSLIGFQRDDEDEIKKDVVAALKKDGPREATAIALNGGSRSIPSMIYEKADAILEGIRVTVHKIKKGKNKKTVNVVVNVYCVPPSEDPVLWLRWNEEMRKIKVPSLYDNTATPRLPTRCNGCHGGDHLLLECPFEKIPRVVSTPAVPDDDEADEDGDEELSAPANAGARAAPQPAMSAGQGTHMYPTPPPPPYSAPHPQSVPALGHQHQVDAYGRWPVYTPQQPYDQHQPYVPPQYMYAQIPIPAATAGRPPNNPQPTRHNGMKVLTPQHYQQNAHAGPSSGNLYEPRDGPETHGDAQNQRSKWGTQARGGVHRSKKTPRSQGQPSDRV
ncbi:uncharacterized protein TRAVEDRAFT_20538 [Trametes versicolor FP-101664 SS1]|uniref:uncharacterized protein n=1 Tax=Trametes versicolor (strain FP-101664) TaxID=717944 RepID=UPI00046243FE|nr:uncharacterized protein TRAVEDRAFT_20538 [Trametes versicolor FP-101664 SS1]EIW58571.1 hypothetical protein TRAVEDRAFT_20538 [Trametes versicolor FP-101664 SS1]